MQLNLTANISGNVKTIPNKPSLFSFRIYIPAQFPCSWYESMFAYFARASAFSYLQSHAMTIVFSSAVSFVEQQNVRFSLIHFKEHLVTHALLAFIKKPTLRQQEFYRLAAYYAPHALTVLLYKSYLNSHQIYCLFSASSPKL